MSESRRRGDEEDEDGGPGLLYMPFVVMDDLLDKLRLLNYEKDFIRTLNLKPISRHYFALPTNPGEQFYVFTSLSAWLIRCTGKKFEQPQEYDDPNATISSILEEVRNFGHVVEFPPSKLKQGYGEHCIYVIDRLADEALRSSNFIWQRPIYPEEEADEENIVEDDSEFVLNEKEDAFNVDNIVDDDDDDDEPMLDLNRTTMKDDKLMAGDSLRPDSVMESKTDAADWKLEVERVLPQLRVTIRTDNKDWRVHVEQMHNHKNGIDARLTETKSNLDKLHDELKKTLEKIASREKYINTQLDPSLREFRTYQDQMAETKERYRQASGGVTERSKVLTEVSEELEKVKAEMEERGSSMTDGAPLVRTKQAIQQLRKENTNMDIRIGVLSHMLLQAKLKDKSSQYNKVHGLSHQMSFTG